MEWLGSSSVKEIRRSEMILAKKRYSTPIIVGTRHQSLKWPKMAQNGHHVVVPTGMSGIFRLKLS